MKGIKLGNAPCSWGTIEGMGTESQRVPYRTMLDELVQAGYTGTELGDYGFMPTDASVLKSELEARGLTMLGAYVDVALEDPAAQPEGVARVLSVARLLNDVAEVGDPDWRPYLVLADVHSRDPRRFQYAGRATAAMALADTEMKRFAHHAEVIARAVKDETGLSTVFHHHCAGFIETPAELERFLALTDPDLLGLVFDTGHYLYGSGEADPEVVLDGLQRFGERVRYLHFKDVDAEVAGRARREEWNYKTAIERGIFCELGQGCIDFGRVIVELREFGYSGWMTVEQDMLPGLGTPKESAARSREFLRSLGL